MSSGWPYYRNRTAADLARLLESARAYLASVHPRVCPHCGRIFSRDLRLDMRCPACAGKERPA